MRLQHGQHGIQAQQPIQVIQQLNSLGGQHNQQPPLEDLPQQNLLQLKQQPKNPLLSKPVIQFQLPVVL